ncbi:trypsin-like peptidase domain-containing protein [Streptomyces sp. NPDC020799]|uniref:nSTAND1 domain-containing NTPase n=1 Tax=Streptomyces sp. NPDC020799 TaxID=3365091 RepID=UPI00378CA4B6
MPLPPGAVERTGPKALDAAVLRICDARGIAVGLGFLVTADRALTCAHVVSAALGLPESTPPDASARLVVDLPLLSGAERGGHRAEAHVEHWVAAQPSGTGDVAVLRLSTPLPDSQPVRLVEAQDVWGHPVRAFGFPAGRPGGVWHSGVLRARQSNGWVQADLAAHGYRISRGFSGGPVWDEKLVGVIGMVTVAEAGDPPAGYLVPTDGLLKAWSPLRELTLLPSPFRSLMPFQEADEEVFHGRRAETDELVGMLARERWTTLVGPSGSGKSSLALAGVVPRLRAAGTCAVVVRPASGRSPLSALAAALLPLLEPELTATQQLERTPDLAGLLHRQGLADVVPRLPHRHATRQLLIVVDQFEELLALAPTAIDELAGVLFHDSLPSGVRVLTTLRADFLEAALAHPGLGPLCGRQIYALGPMNAGQLREIVTAPVDVIPGVHYEPHLVDRILADTSSEPGALALLGFTLDLLWQHQTGGLLTHQAYEELGGVSGALGAYADEAWKEYVLPEDEATARRLFTQLIRVPMGSAAATRRTVPRPELDTDQWRIAQELARTRLLVTDLSPEGRETVELAHEALITGWARLREWADKDRSFLVWRESLRHDMDRWEHGKRAPDLLPTAMALDAARDWLRERAADLSDAERDYVQRGRAHRSRRTRRRRGVLAVICVLALLATAFSVLAVQRGEDAAHKTAVVQSSRLAADAEAARATDPGLAAQLAVAAYRSAPTQETATELYAAARMPLDSVVGVTGKGVLRVATEPDGPLAAAVGVDGALRIWDLADRTAPASKATLHTRPTGIAFAPHNRKLLAGGCPDPGYCLWDLTAPRHPVVAARLPLPAQRNELDQVTSMAVNADGTLLAAASEQGFAAVWSIEQPTHPRLVAELHNPTQRSSGALAAAAFSPHGNVLATTILGGKTQLWNLSNPSAPTKASTMDTGYSALAFSPDGSLLAAVGDLTIGLWGVKAPAKPEEFKVSSSAAADLDLMAVAFSPDSRRLAMGGVHSGDTNSEFCLLAMPRTSPNDTTMPSCTKTGYTTLALAYAHSGALLSGGSDGVVRSWNLPVPEAHAVSVTSSSGKWAFSPDGHLMAATVEHDTSGPYKSPSPSPLGIWDLSASGGPVRVATVTLPDLVQQVAFLSPAVLLSVAHDGAVQLWNLRDPRHPAQAASLGTAEFVPGPPIFGGESIADTGVRATASGDLVSLQGADRKMHLWHIAASGKATESGSVPLPDRKAGLGVILEGGDTAMVVTAAGIDWWDISDPAHPVRGESTRLPGANTGDLAWAHNVVTVATTKRDHPSGGKTLRLFDVTAGKVRSSVTLQGLYGGQLNMSNDGRRLVATGTGNNTVVLWDISDPAHPGTPATVRTLQDTHGIAISPDNQHMAIWDPTSAQRGDVQLWDIGNAAAPTLTATVTPPTRNSVYAVGFPRNHALAMASGSSVFSFDTSPSEVADLICSYTGSSVTAEQWKKYAPGTPHRKPCHDDGRPAPYAGKPDPGQEVAAGLRR